MTLTAYPVHEESALEARLNALCHMEAVSPHIDNFERYEYFQLVNTVAKMVSIYGASRNSLGLDCARAGVADRSSLFTLMTANAVIEAKNRLQRSPVVVELGTGSGLNAVAACLADKDVRYVGYERNENAIGFANILFKLYGCEDRVEIRNEDFLTADFSGINPDVVVNENIHSMLMKEPQLEAAKAILPHAHDKTVFVPGGFDVYLTSMGGADCEALKNDVNLGRLDMTKIGDLPVRLCATVDKSVMPENTASFSCVTSPLNFRNEAVMRTPSMSWEYFSTTERVRMAYDPLSSGKYELAALFHLATRWEELSFPQIRFSLTKL